MEARTPWGDCFASVFKRVSGKQLNQTDLSNAIIHSYGKALGKLHQLSCEYTPIKNKRWSYSDVLDWIEGVLKECPHETEALLETKLLQDCFAAIPITKHNFGLIHYDFEFDNVFYDEQSKSCSDDFHSLIPACRRFANLYGLRVC